MKTKRIHVHIQCLTIDDYNFDYDQPAGEQVYERFIICYEDTVLNSIDVYQIINGVKTPVDKVETKENTFDNYRDVCFYPTENTLIELNYEKSPHRVAFKLDLSEIRHLLSATEITKLPSPVSYFYTDSDEYHDYSHNFDEEKTYYYDDGEGISFIVRLNKSVDLRLILSDKEYLPQEVEECRFGKQQVYEYRFGTIDDFDPARRNYPNIPLHAPSTTAKFIINSK